MNARGRCHANSGFNLVRWIMVVTLGCSLGLLMIYLVVATGVFRPKQIAYIVVRPRVQPRADAAFKLSEDAMERELTAVIQSQLSAFRRDDYPEAYKYAATPVKAQMPLPVFERMVRTGFPFIARNHSAQFGVILDNGDEALVNLTITDESGRTRHYQYLLQQERAGWRICAVSEVRDAGITL